MRIRIAVALALAALSARRVPAQEHPVRRLANVVSVAVEEYGKGVDERGRVISASELQEASDFLADAKAQAARLSGDRAPAARVALDSIILAVGARVPPS